MVRAQFPSLLASDGARVLEPGADTLGIAVDSETDARVVNQDAADDGVTSLIVNLDAAQVLANLSVMVRVAEGAPEGPRYLNALIDLDQDGAWGGSPGGQPEWVVKNVAVDVAPGATVRADPPAFGLGGGEALSAAAWMRVLLTREPLAVPDWTGTGEFEFGEVEDYLVVMPASPVPLVRCESPLALRGVFLRPFTCEVTNLGSAGDVGVAFDAVASALPVLPRESVLRDLATGETRRITGLAFNTEPNVGFVALPSVADAPSAGVADGRVTPLLQPGQWTQGASTEAVPEGLTLTDDAIDLFHGDPAIAEVRADGSVDIQFWGSGTIDLAGERAGDILGSQGILSCQRRFVTAGPTVICGPDEPEPALYRVVWMALADVVPLIDEELVRTYGVMFQDGDPANDFKALPQFANDVLGDADVHFWLQSDGLMWTLRRTEGPNLRDTVTRAFAVLGEEVVAFFIPRTEIAPQGDGPLGALPLIADFPGTGVGVAAYSGPAIDPFGLEATSDRAPGAQEPLLDVAQATLWDLVYDELVSRV